MSAQFEDGKDEGALRTIGEVSRALGIKTHVLRYWEQQFPLLEPLKRSGGRRYYRAGDIELIERIDQLVNREGYTLKGAIQLIESGSTETVSKDEIVEEEIGASGQETSVAASSPELPAELPAELPTATDGGVDAFFGRESYADTPGDIVSETDQTFSIDHDRPVDGKEFVGEIEGEIAKDSGLSRTEILEQLRSIRTRLADALAA